MLPHAQNDLASDRGIVCRGHWIWRGLFLWKDPAKSFSWGLCWPTSSGAADGD
jgi:hypothetical protein